MGEYLEYLDWGSMQSIKKTGCYLVLKLKCIFSTFHFQTVTMQFKIQFFFLLFLLAGSVDLFSQKDSTDFVFTWRTYNPGISYDSSITIRTQVFLPFDFDVDWDNDGIFDTS